MSIENKEDYNFSNSKSGLTSFVNTGQKIYLSRLFDMDCGFCGLDEGPYQTRGLFILDTKKNRYNNNIELIKCFENENQINIKWQTSDECLQIESDWRFDAKTGVWSRRDKLKNTGNERIVINRYLARFTFSPGNYEVYTQQSTAINENQGRWQDVHHKMISQTCKEGRSCEGATPILGIREKDEKLGTAFHVVPVGNWLLRVSSHHKINSFPFVVVEAGISDLNLKITLESDELWEAPEILFHNLPSGEIHQGSYKLHQYINEYLTNTSIKEPPVVYNTWFDDFEHLKLDRLRKQLKAAQKAGCEVFVVDAGWFGSDEGHWAQQVGNWQEKQESAFLGNMKKFADEVREAGLGFGLWMEPERVSPETPIYQEHPQWFVSNRSGFYYHDLSQMEVYSYLLAEITRLIETYELAWMKIDFNFAFGYDPSHSEFYKYYKNWYSLLDELQNKYPDVFFEGCAGGGLRSDINTVTHFDGHFLSDTVNPYEVLRIYQSACLRLHPGRITKWAALRNIGQVIPPYEKPLELSDEAVITAGGANWENSFNVPLEFIIRAALPGIIALTGDIASLNSEYLEKIKFDLEFYKEWREFITDSVLYLLTPPKPKGNWKGWVAFQLRQPGSEDNLVFVYRLKDNCERKKFFLQGIKPGKKYRIIDIDNPQSEHSIKGKSLRRKGFKVGIESKNSAVIFKILEEN